MKTLRAQLIDATLATLQALASSGRPVVVGPWLGEIGFELLYWIPFLRWATTAVTFAPGQLTAISRGGCASWYANITPQYLELFDAYTPAEFREANLSRVEEQSITGRQFGVRYGRRTAKQYGTGAFDHDIIARLAPESGALHPSLMYNLFRHYWRRRVPDLYRRCSIVRRLHAPTVMLPSLPASFVAVKFYSSQACRDRDAHQATIQRMIKTLARVSPVVLLETGDTYDEHGSFLVDAPVIRVPLEPRTNLAVQTAIIARATSFVGTYGGFAYLAPLLGVPTLAVYADRNFRDDHFNLAAQLFAKQRVRFAVQPLDEGAATVQREWKAWTRAA